MVRLGLIVMVLVLTGCSALGDAFSGDPQVAGRAAGHTLTVDRLANMVGRAQRIPIRPDVLTGVAAGATCTTRPWCSPRSGRWRRNSNGSTITTS